MANLTFLPARGLRRQQRGAATLAVAVLLFFAMLLAALFVNRNLLTEQRSAAQQVRGTQAFEAAEAGLDWALAQLNRPQRIGTDCQPSAASPVSFRERYLAYQPRTGMFTPAAQQPACVRNAAGWSCSCAAQGGATLSADADGALHPTFTVTLLAGDRPGVVRLRSQGCSHLARPCAAAADERSDATAQVEVTLALMPGLAQPPAAALVVRGNVDASAALGVHNADPRSGGVALHAGGNLQAPSLRLTAPAGSSPASALVSQDEALAATSTQALFASSFGTDRAAWRSQPMVRRLACNGECGAELVAAIGSGVVQQLIAVDGALRVDGPVVLGTPQRPVAIVVDGPVQFNGAVKLHGLVHATEMRWDGTPPNGALLRGAVLLEGSFAGAGTPDIARDAEVLAQLHGNSGSFARVSGSWRDF